MTFDLFGIDCFKELSIFGVYVCCFKNDNGESRSLFLMHLEEGYLRVNVLWIRII